MVYVNLCKSHTIFRLYFPGQAGLSHSFKNGKEEIKKKGQIDKKEGTEGVIHLFVSYFKELCRNIPGDTKESKHT
jgi:hypothetical protein